MKNLLAFTAVAALVAFAGCNNTPPGGPGATNKNNGVGTPENSFKLSLPETSTAVKQGEKQTAKIGISRGKNFDQDVTLSFDNLPQGVTITPAHPVLKAGEKDVTLSVEAARDAALGDFTINVTGKPAREGAATTGSFKVTVKKP
ncbi:MAG TPA: hypothetical protein VFA26_08395 [Gemmataceae bacterium]|nr:hypothetical protein [Gemmataceae bacterium]